MKLESIRNVALMVVIAIGIAGAVMAISWVSMAFEAWRYGPLVESIDPSAVQWWHWFVWNEDISNVVMFVHFPDVWWTITVIMAIIIGAGATIFLGLAAR